MMHEHVSVSHEKDTFNKQLSNYRFCSDDDNSSAQRINF